MHGIIDGIIGLFRKKSCALDDPECAESLRLLFKTRYHNFKLLLAANNNALKIMTDMEQTLRGGRVFGSGFVRSACTGVSVNVYRLVQYLETLAPDKYKHLFTRFMDIREKINAALEHSVKQEDGRFILWLHEIDREMAELTGSKMASIGEVKSKLGLPVPEGFVITSAAFRAFLAHNDLKQEIDRLLLTLDVEKMENLEAAGTRIRQLIMRSDMPDALLAAIIDAYRELEKRTHPGVRISVRSSALGEDSADTSFAGQYKTELNVGESNIIEAYKQIAASKYSVQAMAYRLNRGIPDEEVDMCAGCMAMVDARAGGVTYSANPLNVRDDSILITSVWGLPKAVVDGSTEADTIVVGRASPLKIISRNIPLKEQEFVCEEDEGICRMELSGEKGAQSSIKDDEALVLADVAIRLEEYWGMPQDVEWAVGKDGKIFFLQCRPLKVLNKAETHGSELHGKYPVIVRGGATASPGVASGPVYRAEKHADALLFPDGAVLVTERAFPRWAAILNRACAVVTEQGSLTGHLANVAREFGVPAVFGMPEALARLENGRIVTVDADNAQVYDGRIGELIEAAGQRKNLMEGSQVHKLLKEVMEFITPLNLVDPDSRDFIPENCLTLHDITRFVHEMSVREMFNFGRDHHFSERMSKQLFFKVPMQWWILNIDDGFADPGDRDKERHHGWFTRHKKDTYVYLEDIVSEPMLAIWEGVVAIPWAGPPAIDGKGLMSIMVQATANTNLHHATDSEYANRNYFMISKNFCSLYSRFGFHFSTIEALLGDRPAENYVSFKFKGGAADYDRKVRRANFVGEILQEFGFLTRIEEDALFARLMGEDYNYMRNRLIVLGYLIIHTRQLDMIMSNPVVIRQYFNKIVSDLRSIIGEKNS